MFQVTEPGNLPEVWKHLFLLGVNKKHPPGCSDDAPTAGTETFGRRLAVGDAFGISVSPILPMVSCWFSGLHGLRASVDGCLKNSDLEVRTKAF